MDPKLLGSLFDPRPMQEAGAEGGEGGTGGESGTGPVFDEASFSVFKEGLGELGKDNALEPIKDFNGLVKGFVEAQKMIGRSIRLPAKELSDEDRGKAVGEIKGKLTEVGILEAIPESPEKYEIKFPQEEGWSVNEALHSSYRGAAHKNGLTASQVQGMFDWYVNFQADSEAKELADFKAMKEGLKTEWGALYARRMEAARRAIVKHVGPDADELISELPPAVGYKWLKAFSAIGDSMLEADFTVGERPTGIGDAESIWKKMNEMMNDKDGPLINEAHSGHKAAVEEYNKLNKAYSMLKGGK